MKSFIATVIAVLALSVAERARASESCTCPSSGLLSATNGTDTNPAVYGESDKVNGVAIWGTGHGNNGTIGVIGAGNQYGVEGSSSTGDGVYGSTSANVGGTAAGFFTTAAGTSSTAVAAENTNGGTGLYASSNSGYAGYFNGTTIVTNGNMIVASGYAYYVGLTCVAGCSGSDLRLKKAIAPIHGALDKLLELKGVSFAWKDPSEHQDHTGTQIGVIAQDVEKVFPQWVSEDEKGVKSVDPDPRTALALTVEAVRELKTQNDDLRDRVRSLEANRRPMISGLAGGGVGLITLGLGAMVLAFTRRQRAS